MSEPPPLSEQVEADLLRLRDWTCTCESIGYTCEPHRTGEFAAIGQRMLDMATEIAALRAVSSQQQQRAQLAEEKLEGYRQALERELCSRHRKGLEFARDCFSPAAGSVDQCLRLRRVLAGKEAQR